MSLLRPFSRDRAVVPDPEQREPGEDLDLDAVIVNNADRYEIAEYALYRKAFESFEHREPGSLGD